MKKSTANNSRPALKAVAKPRSRIKQSGAKKPAKLSVRQQMAEVALKHFDFDSFRPGQVDIIETVLSGRDCVALMPTGAGKSLCFQLPSLMLDKPVLVVSPLISLMQDQHDKMTDLGIATAKLNSTLTASEETEATADIAAGKDNLIYVTPERLENEDYLEMLVTSGISLVVIDEAHCISQWGHDFRPAYLALGSAIDRLGRPPVLAVTATATDDVVKDIVDQLKMRHPHVVKHGIDRPNLIFRVANTLNEDQKRAKILSMLAEIDGSGLIYVSTVKTCIEVAQWLADQQITAAAYHGKLSARERESVQDDFMAGRHKAIVATKAFGMGIDKSDVRFVIHYQFPDSIESYYQEAGRAGRDGNTALALLLYQLEDKRVQSYFLGGKYPSRADAESLLSSLKDASAAGEKLNLATLSKEKQLPLNKLRVVASYLEGAGVIKKTGGLKLIKYFDNNLELDKFLQAYESRHQSDRERLDQIMHYAQTTGCRVAFLRLYFGEEAGKVCGMCDNCKPSMGDTDLVA